MLLVILISFKSNTFNTPKIHSLEAKTASVGRISMSMLYLKISLAVAELRFPRGAAPTYYFGKKLPKTAHTQDNFRYRGVT